MGRILVETNTMPNNSSVLKEYYSRYLRDVRGLSESSVKHYFDALNNISRRLKAKNLIKDDIYEVGDLEELDRLRTILYADADFVEANERGRRMYSAGLNNYYRFASGEEFQKAKDKIILLDIPIAPEKTLRIEHDTWKRSGIMRAQAMESTGYVCEINAAHESFIAAKNNKPYMEGHHAIPMHLQPRFQSGLDVYANIVCLCPVCHRRIHYGLADDKKQMMNQIYETRADRLAHCGIELSKSEFVELAQIV